MSTPEISQPTERLPDLRCQARQRVNRRISSQTNKSDPFLAVALDSFFKRKKQLLANRYGPKGRLITHPRVLDTIADLCVHQIKAEAMRLRHAYENSLSDAEAERLRAKMLAEADCFQGMHGANFDLDACRLEIIPKADSELESVLDWVANSLANGAATPELLNEVKEGKLPSGVPSRLRSGDADVNLAAWLADLAAFLADATNLEQAEQRIAEVMRNRAECVRALQDDDERRKSIRFLAKLVLASGRLDRKQ